MNKYDIIKRHNPKFTAVDFESVLSVGNSDFVYNCDITGFQTLYAEYLEKSNPLTIMSNNSWASYADAYELSDLVFDEYERVDGKWVKYPANENPKRHFLSGESEELLTAEEDKMHNSAVYNALRQSPHRANLGCLKLLVGGKELVSTELSNINCELDLLTGSLHTTFMVNGVEFETTVLPIEDEPKVLIMVKSKAYIDKSAKISYTSTFPTHKIEAGDLDESSLCYLNMSNLSTVGEFAFEIKEKTGNQVEISPINLTQFAKIKSALSSNFWAKFWDKVKIIKLNDKTDESQELERREILSLYNLALHSSGSMPPQETGLMCNSWYGKFHLEMHLWHSAWASLYGVSELTEKSFDWYLEHLPQAKENAERNGFMGYRWPKMIGPDAIDSPSFIAPLLIWQQSHIIFLLHLVYGLKLPKKFYDLVQGTIDFMCDFVVYDEKNDQYNICGPIQCAQEEFGAMSVFNPTFELAYWKHCIGLALAWFTDPNTGVDSIPTINLGLWQNVHSKLAIPKPINGLYPSHAAAPDTFPNFMKDHPMQLAILGMFDNEDVDKMALKATLQRVLSDWDEQSMWGWDYGYMSLLAHALGDDTLAKQILLKECPKNYYAANGHNFQLGRTDLPSYLPGNGAFLWALHELYN